MDYRGFYRMTTIKTEQKIPIRRKQVYKNTVFQYSDCYVYNFGLPNFFISLCRTLKSAFLLPHFTGFYWRAKKATLNPVHPPAHPSAPGEEAVVAEAVSVVGAVEAGDVVGEEAGAEEVRLRGPWIRRRRRWMIRWVWMRMILRLRSRGLQWRINQSSCRLKIVSNSSLIAKTHHISQCLNLFDMVCGF